MDNSRLGGWPSLVSDRNKCMNLVKGILTKEIYENHEVIVVPVNCSSGKHDRQGTIMIHLMPIIKKCFDENPAFEPLREHIKLLGGKIYCLDFDRHHLAIVPEINAYIRSVIDSCLD